ncbi:hypothetical protein [Parvularcula dongshanensis]|uniref:Uncharacterized protein n=1 Tax=Parvularcula dongshanensis TaxID=1173995 RepID=A0A840I324_9PROT|nr:hypothetical protein [Parvularcula dongshanensis]MBB4658673.1 hypothetical protein [Parvularcula dongshanensis]
MLKKPGAKTAALEGLLGLVVFGISRRYPTSRLLIALPLIQAGLAVIESGQRVQEVRRARRRQLGGLLPRR